MTAETLSKDTSRAVILAAFIVFLATVALIPITTCILLVLKIPVDPEMKQWTGICLGAIIGTMFNKIIERI